MIRTTLPAAGGEHPVDVAIAADGSTYVAYLDPDRGLVVEAFMTDPAARQTIFPVPNDPAQAAPGAQGQQRLLAVAGALLLAYKDASSQLAVWDRAAARIATLGEAFDSHPLLWVENAPAPTLAVQRSPDCHVDVGAYPARPTGALAAGVGTGLARAWFVGGEFACETRDSAAADGFDAPCFLSDHEWVAQAPQGGLYVSLLTAAGDAVEGYLLQGESTFDPSIARGPNGEYAIACGARGARGALPATLLSRVTAADLEAFRPSIAPFTTPKLVGAFPSGGATAAATPTMARANCQIVLGSPNYTIRTLNGTVLARLFDMEQGQTPDSGPCLVYMDRASLAAKAPTIPIHQPIVFNAYPEKGETTFAARVQGDIALAKAGGRKFGIAPAAWNRGELSDAEVYAGQQVVRQLADDPDCLAVFPFGINRGADLTPPEFTPAYQAVADQWAAAGLPALEDDVPINVPAVTVDSWTLDQMKPGREFVAHDPNNPQLGTRVRIWIDSTGSMRMELAYTAAGPDKVAQTGARRAVVLQ